MRSIILMISGLVAGYVVGNLETKTIEEIIEGLLLKANNWLETIQDYIGKTLADLEGFDTDIVRINLDAFIDELTNSIDDFVEIDSLDDKISFVEDKIASVTSELVAKVESKK